MSTIFNTIESENLLEQLDSIKSFIAKFNKWYNSLPEEAQERLERLYASASGNLDDAKADISALTSEYLVYMASQIAKEGQK